VRILFITIFSLALLSLGIGVAGTPVNPKKWIDAQWAAIPAKYRVAKPSTKFPISKTDAHFLAANYDPIKRNVYINETYHYLGQQLSQCMGVGNKIGNWFHFATWASLSAGDVINGKKFRELNLFESVGALTLSSCGVSMSEAAQKDLFGAVNAQIAMEMIPLGKAFLKEFCGAGARKDWSAFSKLMSSTSPADKLLIKGMKGYAEAIDTKNYDLKVEKIALASTLQVFSEQTRVDKALGLVFNFDTPGGFGSGQMKSYCTDMGCYVMNNNGSKTSMTLSGDVSAALVPRELQSIQEPNLGALYRRNGVIFTTCPSPFAGTGCSDWSSLSQRKKYLGAMFRGHISNPDLFGNPHPNLGRQVPNLRSFGAYSEDTVNEILRRAVVNRYLSK
jgi:hypothetical protein